MNGSEASDALKMLEETAKLLWRIFSRVLAAVLGVTGTAILQAWLLIRMFPAVV